MIFGFNSIAPTGAQVEKSLNFYLKNKNAQILLDAKIEFNYTI